MRLPHPPRPLLALVTLAALAALAPLTPATAVPMIELVAVPGVIDVAQGDEYVVRVRLTNTSDAGETFGNAFLMPDFTPFASSIGPVVAGQSVAPLFNASLFDPLLAPGESLEFDFARIGTVGVLGPIAPASYLGSVSMTLAFVVGGPPPLVVNGAGSATAGYTLRVLAATEPAALALLLPGLLGLALGRCASLSAVRPQPRAAVPDTTRS